jgi:hypothetical protein
MLLAEFIGHIFRRTYAARSDIVKPFPDRCVHIILLWPQSARYRVPIISGGLSRLICLDASLQLVEEPWIFLSETVCRHRVSSNWKAKSALASSGNANAASKISAVSTLRVQKKRCCHSS